MKLFSVSHLSRQGLKDISLSLSAAELVCLSGPSGAGKTLLLRALADLDMNRGEVMLDGAVRESVPATEWRRQVAYLPAESRWWAPAVGDHFEQDPLPLLGELGFGEDVVDWKVERLSSGERQRLAVARLLSGKPRVLLLDEPTANLDPENIERVERLVRHYLDEQRAGCLWVTHTGQQVGRIANRSLRLETGGLVEVGQAA